MADDIYDNIRVVQSLYEAMARRDMPGVLALLHEDIEIVQTPLLPWGGAYRGSAGVFDFLERLLGSVENRLTLEEYFEAEDRVIVIGRTAGRVLRNDAPFDVRLVHIWTVLDGKAVRFEPYINTPQMLEALDAPDA